MSDSPKLAATGAAPAAQKQDGVARPATPSHEDIARRAYDIYERRGRKPGQCQENWHQAERELRKESTHATHAASATTVPVLGSAPLRDLRS